MPYLIRSFRDVPGYRQVVSEKYCLLHDANGKVIGKKDWDSTIHPGSRVFMAVLTMVIRTERVHCLRCDNPEDILQPNVDIDW